MAHQWFKTQYPGVRFREHTTRKFNSKPDRYFSIYYKLNGKQREEGLGWSSEEWTAQKASIQLAELKKAQTTGEG
ncbi:MAG: site-specific integrase, partial [Syntrophobacteraceae bacterium]